MIHIAKPIIGKDEKAAVLRVLDSGMLAQGPVVGEFEKRFSRFIGTKHAIAVNSGTAALHLTLLAKGIGAGDEVITTPFTFIATANSILLSGAKPVFVDIEEETFNIDPELIRKRITKKTKAIMPVHLYGHPAEMGAIMKIARDSNIAVIEDACQAHGALYHGKKAGSFGIGCFSFYPTKNMTTIEGGMITTNSKKIAKTAKMLRDHGSPRKYVHDILGYNLRMTDIGAAIGIEHLKKLGAFNEKRIKNAKYLTEKLDGIEWLITPGIKKDCTHVFHQYVIRVVGKNRDTVARYLNKKGVGTGIHYPIPIHKQKLYRDLGYRGKFPISERLSREILSLPIHPFVTKKDLDYIIKTLRELK